MLQNLNRLRSKAVERSAWYKRVVQCEDEIASLDPHPYFQQAYRKEEVRYWQNVARWMYQDRQTKVQKSLDIGCAYGTLALLSQELFHCQVYCTDFTDVFMSSSLVQKHNFHFSVNNIELDPFPWNETFDVIIFTEVLEHLNFHPIPTLQKIRSLLSAGGRVYLSTPDAAEWGHLDHPYANIDAIPYPQKGMPVIDAHVYQYGKDELVRVITAAGFRIERFGFAPGVAKRHFNLTMVPTE